MPKHTTYNAIHLAKIFKHYLMLNNVWRDFRNDIDNIANSNYEEFLIDEMMNEPQYILDRYTNYLRGHKWKEYNKGWQSIVGIIEK